jgi:hypothetical protein
MDPQQAWDEIVERAEVLKEWLDRGGYFPPGAMLSPDPTKDAIKIVDAILRADKGADPCISYPWWPRA